MTAENVTTTLFKGALVQQNAGVEKQLPGKIIHLPKFSDRGVAMNSEFEHFGYFAILFLKFSMVWVCVKKT